MTNSESAVTDLPSIQFHLQNHYDTGYILASQSYLTLNVAFFLPLSLSGESLLARSIIGMCAQ